MRNFLVIFMFLFSMGHHAYSGVIWAGGEDVDFPNGAAVCSATGSLIRSAYARVGIYPCTDGQMLISNTFPGGPITSAWISARIYISSPSGTYRMLGLGKSGSNASIWVGLNGGKVALFKYDGTTSTALATETTLSLNSSPNKIDLEIINYGPTATIRVYTLGSATPRITYTGDVTALGNTELDRVQLLNSNFYSAVFSEIFVADSDTRTMSLATLAPNAAGTSGSGWIGAHTDINETAIADATSVSSSNSGDIFQSGLSNMPAGSFSVLGIKLSSRATKTSTGPGSLSIGVATNSSNDIPVANSLLTTWSTYESYYSTNPITSTNWTTTEVNALELLLQSAP